MKLIQSVRNCVLCLMKWQSNNFNRILLLREYTLQQGPTKYKIKPSICFTRKASPGKYGLEEITFYKHTSLYSRRNEFRGKNDDNVWTPIKVFFFYVLLLCISISMHIMRVSERVTTELYHLSICQCNLKINFVHILMKF